MSDEKLKTLKQNRLKRCTKAKVQWVVRACNEWRNMKLGDPLTYDYCIYYVDINVINLTKLI